MKKLKDIRKSRNITQQELAARLGITQVTLCRYETGNRKLPVEMAKKIASILSVNWYDLYEK